MSSGSFLAPFVAAVLRDRTVDELMDKVKKQEEIFRALMTIEITGPGGSPVYATGQFDKGSYGDGVNDWCPELQEERVVCQLNELWGLEIRLGGVVQCVVHPGPDDHRFEAELTPMYVEEHHGDLRLRIGFEGGTTLSGKIEGWEDDDELREIIRAQDEDDELAEDWVVLEFADFPNNRVVRFDAVIFHSELYRGLIETVQPEEQRQAHLQDHENRIAAIAARRRQNELQK